MTRRRPLRSEVFESEPVWTRALILRESDGQPARVSDGETFALYVYNLTNFGLVYSLVDQPISDALSNALQTNGWDGSAAGYNFAWGLQPSDATLLGDNSYRFEFAIDWVSDGRTMIVHECDVQGIYST